MAKPLLSTGDLQGTYEIIDVIFAMDSHKDGMFTGADPEKAFVGVKEELRKKCLRLGGNAVINCQFEYRAAVDKHLVGASQVFEIFAYGTAVKR